MIEPGREWQAIALAEAAEKLASQGRVSMVDRAYYTGIADMMRLASGEDPPTVVWPDKLQLVIDRYYDSI